MSTPFIKFGGYGSSVPCQCEQVLDVGLVVIPRPPRGIPGALQKIPTPGSTWPSQKGRGKKAGRPKQRRKNSGHKHRVAAADPLVKQGLRSPVTSFVIIQSSGVWGVPSPANGSSSLAVGTPSATCQRLPSLPLSPTIPTQWIGKSPVGSRAVVNGKGGGGDRIPWIWFAAPVQSSAP
ncbi:hypothetical protein V8C35DRAFT_306303 [Trichoderma chlorosporum]